MHRSTLQKVGSHGQIQASLLLPRQFIPIFFDKQIQKSTFEYTLSYLVDKELDLTIFDLRFRNDHTGTPAYDPRILLKIILFAYSRGITSNCAIVQCCGEIVLFMALSANSRPHFITIADFISSMDKEVIHLFLFHIYRRPEPRNLPCRQKTLPQWLQGKREIL